MDTPEQFAAADLPDAMPERWETAIEDLAQAIALGLDRAQDLADAINDLVRTRPVVAKAAGAAIIGAAIGTFIASKTMHRPKPKIVELKETAEEATSAATSQASLAIEQALAIARATAERMANRLPPKEEMVNGAAHAAESMQARLAPKRDTAVKKAGYAAQLLPLTVALLKNPLVRDMLIRAAMKTARRRK
jgi:hypothetical protein